MMMSKRPQAPARVLCVLAVLIGVTACSTFKGDSTPAAIGAVSGRRLPVVAHIPHVTVSLNLRLPLDSYLWSVDDMERISLARRAIIGRCMQRFGIKIVLPNPITGIGPRTWMQRRYGLASPTEAATRGYGLGRRDPSTQPHGRGIHMGALALAVLTGEGEALPTDPAVPVGGCSGEAKRILNGRVSESDPQVDSFLAQRLSMMSFERTRRDPRVLSVFDAWSRCMRRAGHYYDDPLAPFADERVQGDSMIAIHTAMDDVACKRRTNVIGTWYAVECAYQRDLIDHHRTALAYLAAANAVTSAAVQHVLDGREGNIKGRNNPPGRN